VRVSRIGMRREATGNSQMRAKPKSRGRGAEKGRDRESWLVKTTVIVLVDVFRRGNSAVDLAP
jgi:hypothetical protein